MIKDLNYNPKNKKEHLLNLLKTIVHEIGNTPLYTIRNLQKNPAIKIYAKKEWHQLSGSVKARAAFRIIEEAIKADLLDDSKSLLDASSGNTGIAYAHICKKLGLSLTLCLPENASEKRKEILKSLDVNIIYTSKFEGTDGAQEVAAQLSKAYPEKYFYANQYANPNNWLAHFHGTADEILKSVPGVSHFIAGLGTTGTFTGTSRKLKLVNPDIQCIALQPSSPMHGLEGWKHLETANIPKIYNPKDADEIVEIDASEVYDFIPKVYDYEGLWLSPSAAANLLATLKIAERLEAGQLVTILADNADKYEEVLQKIGMLHVTNR